MKKMLLCRLYVLVIVLSLSSLLTSDTADASTTNPIIYQYPVIGAKNVRTGTGIGIRLETKITSSALSNVSFKVTSKSAGRISGSTHLADDGRTIIFTPSHPFTQNDNIHVSITSVDGSVTKDFSFSTGSGTSATTNTVTSEELFFSLPRLLQLPTAPPPPPTMTIWENNTPSDGYIFFNTLRAAPNNLDGYLMALENSGNIRWIEYKPFVSPNFQPHPDGRYTYMQSNTNAKESKFIILDENMQQIREVKAPSDYATRIHEILLLPDNHVMILGRYTTVEDLSPQVPGGQTSVNVDQTAIVELDSSGNTVFEWRTEDHYKVTDATHEDLTAAMVNYSFINALAIDNDGQLLASSRRMDEITKIDRQTGNMIWRLGGKNNQFTLIGDTTWFSHSHNIQALPNGHYILFDNGLYNTPKVSRALEYVVDTAAKTVTQVWQYTHPDGICGEMMGSVQRLSGGNTLIGWGTNTSRLFTEVTPEGNRALEMSTSDLSWSYRVYKAVRNLPQNSVSKDNHAAGISDVHVYPNPAVDHTAIEVNVPYTEDVTISLEDYLGRTVSSFQLGRTEAGKLTKQIDVSSFVKGMYFCKVHIGSEQFTTRFLVQ